MVLARLDSMWTPLSEYNGVCKCGAFLTCYDTLDPTSHRS